LTFPSRKQAMTVTCRRITTTEQKKRWQMHE